MARRRPVPRRPVSPQARWLRKRLAIRATQTNIPKITQRELAAHLGVAESAISKIWTESRQPPAKEIVGIAEFLNTPVEAVLEWLGAPRPRGALRVAIAGFVGAGAVINGFDDYARGGGHGEVESPRDLDPETVVAVQVRGDSMWPLNEGWRLFFRRDWIGVVEDDLYQLCVVETENGKHYVKELRPGREPETFTLYAWSAEPIENVRLKWAARVLAMIPA